MGAQPRAGRPGLAPASRQQSPAPAHGRELVAHGIRHVRRRWRLFRERARPCLRRLIVEVAVIGRGMAGLLCSLELARRGTTVVLFGGPSPKAVETLPPRAIGSLRASLGPPLDLSPALAE